ncbi:MAG: molecular chaperone TorD family protein, partial [Thermogutta sp.]|uniref:molecular chaperone TorD family protein n=1 Tax=Thermogutta sp. TaxID=1962930 RepID=UPI0019B7FC78
ALYRIAENWCSDPATEEYFRIVCPGGQVSLRAVSYLPLVSPGEMLATLEELYDRMGYRNRTEEPPDHLAVLADCYAFLSLRAAYMLANQRQDDFLSFLHLRDHLALQYLLPVLSSLVEKLQNHQIASLRATVEWMRDVLHSSACHNLSPPSQVAD